MINIDDRDGFIYRSSYRMITSITTLFGVFMLYTSLISFDHAGSMTGLVILGIASMMIFFGRTFIYPCCYQGEDP